MRIFAVNEEAKTLKVVRLVFAGHKCGIGEFSENILLKVFWINRFKLTPLRHFKKPPFAELI